MIYNIWLLRTFDIVVIFKTNQLIFQGPMDVFTNGNPTKMERVFLMIVIHVTAMMDKLPVPCSYAKKWKSKLENHSYYMVFCCILGYWSSKKSVSLASVSISLCHPWDSNHKKPYHFNFFPFEPWQSKLIDWHAFFLLKKVHNFKAKFKGILARLYSETLI